jgi:hypothetical protein
VAVVRKGGAVRWGRKVGGAGRRGGVGAVSRGWWWRSAVAVLERRKKGEDRKLEEEERKGKVKWVPPGVGSLRSLVAVRGA